MCIGSGMGIEGFGGYGGYWIFGNGLRWGVGG